MKMNSFLVGLSLLTLLSCGPSEENPFPPAEEELHPVKFAIMLKEEVLPFPDTRSIPPLGITQPTAITRGDDTEKGLKDLCCTIEYIVYKEGENSPIRSISYCKEDLDFGIISDEFPRGEYEISIIAHNSPPATLSENNLIFDKVSDTFYYSFHLDIKPGEKNEEDIILYRVVSKVEFVSTDIIPDDAKELSIQLDKYPCLFNFKTGYGEIQEETPQAFSYPLTDHIGETGLTHSFFTFVPQGGTSITATLKAVNTEDNILRERTVEDIEPIVNKIIRYTGRLYNPSHSNDEFTITIDENGEWSGTIETDLGD